MIIMPIVFTTANQAKRNEMISPIFFPNPTDPPRRIPRPRDLYTAALQGELDGVVSYLRPNLGSFRDPGNVIGELHSPPHKYFRGKFPSVNSASDFMISQVRNPNFSPTPRTCLSARFRANVWSSWGARLFRH